MSVRVYSHQEMISFWSERDPPVDPDRFGTLFSPVCRPPTPLEEFKGRTLGIYNGFRSRSQREDHPTPPNKDPNTTEENPASQQSPLGRDKTSRTWTAPKFAPPKVLPQSGFAPPKVLPQSGFAPPTILPQTGFTPQPLDHSEEQEARRKAEEEARLRIEQERRQAEEAKREAEEAKRQAEQARREAEEARRKAEEERRKAQREAEEAKRQAEQARREAEEERRRIEEERRKIEEERRRMEENARAMQRANQTSFREIQQQQKLEATKQKQNPPQEKPKDFAWGARQPVKPVSVGDALKASERPSNPPEPQQPRSKKGKGKAIVLSLEDFAREVRKPAAWEDVGDSKPHKPRSFAEILDQDEDESPPPRPSQSKKKGKFKKGQSMPLQDFLAANKEPPAPQPKAPTQTRPSFSAIMAEESEAASQPKKEPTPQNSRSSKKKGKKVSMSLQEFLQESSPKPSEAPQPMRAQPKKVTSFSSIMEEDEEKEAVQPPRSRKKGKQKKVVYDLNAFVRDQQWQTVESDDSDDEPRRPARRPVPSMAEILAADEAEERARKQRERSGPTSASFQGPAKKGPAKSFAELMKEDEEAVDVITTGVIQDFVPGHRYELPERKPAPVKPADAEDLFWGAATQEEVQRNQKSRTNDPAGFLCKLIEEATGETDMYEFAVSLMGRSQRDMVNSINTVTSTRSEATSIVDRFLRKYPAHRR